MGDGGEFWQNVVHWRRAWQTTSVFLPWESHEQYEERMVGVLNQEITLMRELVVGAILIKGYRLTYKMSRFWELVCGTGAVISTCCCLVIQSCLTLCDLMDCSLPGSSVHGFPRQGSWSGLPFPSPGHFHNPGIKPGSPALQVDSFTIWATKKNP